MELRQGVADDGHPGGLVPASAMALRSEEGRIGLDHQTVEGNASRGFAKVRALLEGDDPRERDVEPVIHRASGKVEVARVAVEHALELVVSFGDPDLEQLLRFSSSSSEASWGCTPTVAQIRSSVSARAIAWALPAIP